MAKKIEVAPKIENKDKFNFGVLVTEVKNIAKIIQEIKDEINTFDKKFITRIEFEAFKRELTPIRTIVYGMVALILTAVVGALVTLVVRG